MISALRRRIQGTSGGLGPGQDPPPPGPPPAPRKQGRDLATLIADCAATGAERSVLAVRLSRLPATHRRPHHVRLVLAALDPLTFADRASLFELANQDLVVTWRGAAAAVVESCRRAIIHIFAGDPATEETVSPRSLLESWRLPADTRQVLAILEDSVPSAPASPEAAHAAERTPLDAATVAALEEQLRYADMAPFVRRRPVCAIGPDGRMITAWERRLLAVEELVTTLLPDRAVDPEGWLFRRLSRTLDRRMLALLSDPEELRQAGPFSLDLNISSILSPEFLRFDDNLPGRLRGEVVLGILPADMVADPSAFLLAREFARVRGYVLLLRDVGATALPVFSREEVGVDWLQLRWNPHLAAQLAPLADIDPGHLVLSGADVPAALAWGRAHHVARFAGTAVHPG